MTKARFLCLILFLSHPIMGQKMHKLSILPHNTYTFFTHKEKYFFMSKDSTYETSDALFWKIYPNKIPVDNLSISYHNTDSCTFVYYSGGGGIYRFDGEKFSKINQENDLKNQFNHASFIYKNQIHLFGGYGLFTEKNIITFFDMKTKEWQKVISKTHFQDSPLPRRYAVTQVFQDDLYMGMGINHIVEPENNARIVVLNDFWKFHFPSKTWEKIGTNTPPNFIHLYPNVIKYKNQIHLVLSNHLQLYGYDLIHNHRIEYPNKSDYRIYTPYVVYNSFTDCFLVVKENRMLMDSVKIFTSEEFLGKKQIISQLYKPINEDQNKFLAGTAFFLLITGVSVFYYRKKYKKLPIYTQIHRNVPKIEALLEEDEYKIFKLIFDNYPNKIPYLELMSQADYKVSYDTQKKKLRTSLDEIDNKIQELLNLEESIFVYAKNESDKRMKEVKIK